MSENERTARCLPKAARPPHGVRAGLVAALAASLLCWIAVDAYAQVGPSGFSIIRAYDGTNVINIGDNTNSAIRVNVVAGSAGGPSKVDDAAFTVATDSVAPAGFMADESSPDSVNEGDVGIGRMSLNRNQYVTLRDNAGNERGLEITAAGEAEVSLTTALPAGNNNIGDVDVASIAAGNNNIGDVDIASLPSSSSANNDGTQVSVTTTSSSALASFSTRKGAQLCSIPTNTDIIYVKFGATAATSDFRLFIGQCMTMSGTPYTGVIDVRSAAGTQSLDVLEW